MGGVSPSREMKGSVRSVEQIIGYRFKNKRLLEEALTHSYSSSSGADSLSYQRLEFLGDAVISLAISRYFFDEYPQLKPGELSDLREAYVSNEKLARVAVRHDLYEYIRRFNVKSLDDQVKKFTEAVRGKDDEDLYDAPVVAPDILADIVESIAAAVYHDVDFDLKRVWMILKDLLKPIPIRTIEDLEKYKHPVKKLFDLCRKQGKKSKLSIGRSAAKSALLKLSPSRSNNVDEVSEIEDDSKANGFVYEKQAQELLVP
ncbi:hypothetical protein FNV43_RR05495 [Rhamnella rubrinervis]|uniref:RNase III domain-containing protein n=1 Tax=Rhamnella rubrinervis TaxID=2594499 RepID=A0A8K0MQQ1_9ROSA|nr:hypothetical protein FNV43_RR05495 [Rhamnella rubrinervis]